jgi:hypothetical protein
MSNYIGNQPSAGEFKKLDSIASSFNGSLTQFDLDYSTVNQSVGDATQLIVSLNGIIQEPGIAYTLGIGGGSIVFASAPASGDTCHIVLLGGVGDTTTPTDGSVTASKLDSSLKDYLEETFTANGSQTTYTLTRAAIGSNSLLLSVDGILQPSTAYSVAGTTLTISPALPNTTNVRVVHLGVQSGVYIPAADSITSNQLATLNGNLNFDDNAKAVFGEGSDLQIYHDGSNSYIADVGTGDFTLKANGTKILMETAGGETLAEFINNGNVVLYSNDVERLRTNGTGIDVTGQVDVNSVARIDSSGIVKSASGTEASPSHSFLNDPDNGMFRVTTNTIGFSTAGSEAMRIDASGNLLVGKTSTNYNVTGVQAFGAGYLHATADISSGGQVVNINRKTSDGELINFRKDGTTVGSIGTDAGIIYAGGGDAFLGFDSTYNIIKPASTSTGGGSNGLLDLGGATRRFKDLYLSGGVYLGGTVAANKLDDYEEGTWTPLFGDNSTTASNGGQFSATYVKIGKLVTVSADITTLTYSGADLNYMYGLPFAGGVSGVGNGGGGIGYTTTTGIVPGLHVTSNTSAIYFMNLGTNVGGEILSISGKRFIFSLTYETS